MYVYQFVFSLETVTQCRESRMKLNVEITQLYEEIVEGKEKEKFSKNKKKNRKKK